MIRPRQPRRRHRRSRRRLVVRRRRRLRRWEARLVVVGCRRREEGAAFPEIYDPFFKKAIFLSFVRPDCPFFLLVPCPPFGLVIFRENL